jgi:hypothetical protein
LLEREELIADEITAAIAEAAGAPGATKSITLPAQPS